MNIYGKKTKDNEIIKFVNNYLKKISKDKNSRFNSILSLVDCSKEFRILDYGCGWGCISYELNKKGHYVEGIDIDENEINISKLVWKENKNLKFLNSQISEIQDSSFDYVISSQVIEHVHNSGNYLDQINRVLKENGFLIITLPNIMTPRLIALNIRNNLEKKLKHVNKKIVSGYDKRNLHINAWDPLHFTHLISTLGFEIIEIKMTEGVPFPFLGYLNLPFLKNLSYTMCFKLKKVKNISIKTYD